MFDVFIEEGFDFEPLLTAFLHDFFVTKGRTLDETRRIDKPSDLPPEVAAERKAYAKKVADILGEMKGMKSSNLRHTELEDNLLELINAETLRLFPEIFNSDPEFIGKLQGIFYSDIRSLVLKIVNLAFEAEKKQ